MRSAISTFLVVVLFAMQFAGCASNRNVELVDPVALTESIDEHVIIYTTDGQWVEGRLAEVGEDHVVVVEDRDEKMVMMQNIEQLTIEGPISVKRTLLFSGGAFAVVAVAVYAGIGYLIAYLALSE